LTAPPAGAATPVMVMFRARRDIIDRRPGAAVQLTLLTAIDERTHHEKRFSIARAELDLLLQLARAVAGAEWAHDRDSTTLTQIAAGIDRVLARAAEQTFQVAVLALVKSGKSTLINALLGEEFLPSSNVPETARIVRVRHAASPEGRLRDGGAVLARGRDEIHSHLRRLNAELRAAGAAAGGDDLLLEAPLAALAGRPLGAHPFEVLDTPGPNEAGAELFRARVDRLLGDADVILYLLDYTKLRTEDERGLFARLAALRPELLRRLSDRLFFAVNKIDLENSKGLSQDETRQYVAEILTAQVPGLTIEPGRVLLLSAEHALLARQVRGGQAGRGTLADFARLCFGFRGQHRATLEDCGPHAGVVLEASRLLELEERVVSFIYQHRGRLYLQSVLDDLERHVGNLDNHLQAARRALHIEHGQLAEQIKRLEADLHETAEAVQQIDAVAARAADNIEAWVRERFTHFQGEVEAEVARTPIVPEGNEGEAPDEAAAHRCIAEAHLRIAALLKAEFGAFWADLELAAWERQRGLFAEMEERIAPLAARIAEAVSQRLEISLRPVRLAIPAPSFDDLHQELSQQIAGFIERRTRNQQSAESRSVLTRKGGWCSEDQYGKQSVTTTREVTVFAPRREKVLAHWHAWIRERTAVSVKTARAIIRDQVGAAANTARQQLAAYGEGYLRVVRQTLAESQRGEQQRQRRLAALEEARRQVAELQDRLGRCREFLLPGDGG
jgi:GTPase SAR1 family protein